MNDGAKNGKSYSDLDKDGIEAVRRSITQINRPQFENLVIELKDVLERLSSFEIEYEDGSKVKMFPSPIALKIEDEYLSLFQTQDNILHKFHKPLSD